MTLKEKMLKRLQDNDDREAKIFTNAHQRGICDKLDIRKIHRHELAHMATETLLIRELLED